MVPGRPIRALVPRCGGLAGAPSHARRACITARLIFSLKG